MVFGCFIKTTEQPYRCAEIWGHCTLLCLLGFWQTTFHVSFVLSRVLTAYIFFQFDICNDMLLWVEYFWHVCNILSKKNASIYFLFESSLSEFGFELIAAALHLELHQSVYCLKDKSLISPHDNFYGKQMPCVVRRFAFKKLILQSLEWMSFECLCVILFW